MGSERQLGRCGNMVEQLGHPRRVFLDGLAGARVVETRGHEPRVHESSVQPRKGTAGSAEAMKQDDEVISRRGRRAGVVEGSLAFGEGAAARDPAVGVEEPVPLAVPAPLHAPPVAPPRIGPQLRAGRLDHPPRSSLSRSLILSSLG